MILMILTITIHGVTCGSIIIIIIIIITIITITIIMETLGRVL